MKGISASYFTRSQQCNRSALTAATLLAISIGTQAADASGVLGTWTLDRIVANSPITGLDDEGLRGLGNESLAISRERISFAGRACEKPTLRISRASSKTFFRQYRMQALPLWSGTVDRLDVTCANAEDVGPFLIKDGRMLWVWYGYALQMTKTPQ